MKFILPFLILLATNVGRADIRVKPYKKNYSWSNEWTEVLLGELQKDEYRNGDTAILNIPIDQEDLGELHCPGYNRASLKEKQEFWVVFFSALTRAESAFNQKARSRTNYGLLQLNPQTAKTHCSIEAPVSNLYDPQKNLVCGIQLMSWQLKGAPTAAGKKIRPDLEGQIFGKNMFQWGPLRQNDISGRSLLVNWFKDHVDQLEFCPLIEKSE